MWSRTMVARALVAGVAATGVLAGGGGAAAASAAMPTCTVTQFKLIAVGTRGTEMGMASARQLCFGTYVFTGVLPSPLGYPNVTTDNYAELAKVLKHWSSIDGGLAVNTWVNLSATLAAGMQAAGVNPTMFLQWVNDANASAWAGTGVRIITGAPPVWPSFVAKGYVSDPATIVGGTADQTVAAPKATPLPQAGPQQPVTPTQAPAPKPAAAATTTRSTGAGTVSRSTPTTSATATAKPAGGAAGTKPTKPVAKPALRPVAPPTVAAAGRTTVPCVVAPTCRQAVVAHDRWLRLPWYHRAALQLWWHRWWEVGGLAILAAAALAARAAIIGRRNLAWYGNVRGPR